MYKKLGVLLLSSILLLTGCSSADQEPVVSKGETMAMYQCARDHLDTPQKQAYDALLQAYQKLETEVILKDIEITELNELIKAVEMDHPEIYYLKEDFSYEYNEDYKDVKYLYYHPKYRFKNEEIKQKNEQIKKTTDPVVKAAKKLDGDYQKVIYVYDYIIDHTVYDENAKENQNILSTFLYGKTVCAGYAKGTQYLLNQLNIPCTVIPGFSREDNAETSHAWNMVKMDGAYYYLDATNGDTEYKTQAIRYMYFAMTKDQILEYNRPYTNEYIEETPSRQDTYFTKEDAYFTSVDMDTMRRVISKSLKNNKGRLVYQCSNNAIAESLYSRLIDSNLIFDLTGYEYYEYYSFDETGTYVFVPAHQEL